MLEKNACKNAPAKTKEHIRPLTITFQGGFLKTVLFLVSTILYQKALCIFYCKTSSRSVGVISKFLVCFGFAGAFLERVVVGKASIESEVGVGLERLYDHFD